MRHTIVKTQPFVSLKAPKPASLLGVLRRGADSWEHVIFGVWAYNQRVGGTHA